MVLPDTATDSEWSFRFCYFRNRYQPITRTFQRNQDVEMDYSQQAIQDAINRARDDFLWINVSSGGVSDTLQP
jgi:hypothetical protein